MRTHNSAYLCFYVQKKNNSEMSENKLFRAFTRMHVGSTYKIAMIVIVMLPECALAHTCGIHASMQ